MNVRIVHVIDYIEVVDMAKVIIIEPDITPEENERNWRRTEEIINLIINEVRMQDEKDVYEG
jgi:sugar diacid utilization regulator